MYKNELSIFISSWDGYSWIWDSFFYFFDKYWKDCPFQLYLSTNQFTFNFKDLIVLKTDSTNWSNMLIDNLNKVKSNYILYLQDDFLLQRVVKTEDIYEALRISKIVDADYVKLNDREMSRRWVRNIKIRQIKDRCGMIVHLQAAIWRRESLMNLLKPKESPWEFEKNSSKEVKSKSNNFYQTNRKLIDYYYSGAIHNKKMFIRAGKRIKKEGIYVDKEKIMSTTESLYYHTNAIYDKLPFNILVPPVVKTIIRNGLLKGN